jgi:predicted O-methyltransferase YrrM
MLPTIEQRNVVDPASPVRLERLEMRDGNAPVEDLELLCRLALALRPRTVFEFGTFCGVTTYNLAKHTPDDCTICTLDLPRSAISTAAFPFFGGEERYAEKDRSGDAFQGTDEAGKIVQYFGDSAVFDFSPWRGVVDLTFVDASHAYLNCLSDSLHAVKMRSDRGVIAWHDYGVWHGVTNALNDLQRSAEPFASLRHVAGTNVAVLLPDVWLPR